MGYKYVNIKDITRRSVFVLFTERHSEHYTNLSTLNHNVRFLPCPAPGVGIMQYVYAKPCVHRFNYSRTLTQFPSGLLDIVNPGNTMTDSSHLTYINKY